MARVAVRGVRAHRVRLVSTVLAVLLGVSFMVGTAVLADTVKASFDEIYVDVFARVDVVVRADQSIGGGFGTQRPRIDAALADRVREVPGVVAVEGKVEGQLRIIAADGQPLYRGQVRPPTAALSWNEVPALDGWTLVAGHAPADGEVVLDQQSATDAGLAVGDPVRLAVATGVVERRVGGIGTFGRLATYAGTPAVLLPSADAQALVGEPGRVDRLEVVVAPETDPAAVIAGIDRLDLTGTEAITGAQLARERQDAIGQAVNLFTQILTAFGFLALFVGSFIISNTFTIIVAQRTRELALLRAVGASRRQILRSVLLEAFVVGALASAMGVLAGLGVAQLLRVLIERFGTDLPDTPLRIDPSRAIVPVLLGIGVTLVSALVPAVKAAGTAPVEALREAMVDRPHRPTVRLLVSVPFALAALAILWRGLGIQGDVAPGVVLLSGVPAIAALAIAGPVVAPPLSLAAGAPLRRFTSFTGRLARANAVRHPTRTSSTACALVIGVALVCVISVLSSSLSATVRRTVDRTVAGDYVVTSDSFLGMSPTVGDRVRDVPGVRTVVGIRGGPVGLQGRTELAVAADPVALGQVLDLGVRDGSLDRLGDGGVAVASEQADRDGIHLGDRLPVTFIQRGVRTFDVVAIYDRALTRNGEYLFSVGAWDEGVPASGRVDRQVLVDAEPGAIGDELRAGLEQAIAGEPTAQVLDVAEYRDRQVGQVSQRISYLYALLGLALLVGVLGIANTLLLSVHERRRELGLLRAVGARRRQLGSSVLQEAVLISVPGAVFGVLLGIGLGWAVTRTVNFDGQLVFAVPWGWLVGVGVGACAAGLVAGLWPARRAGRLPILDAIRTD